jgi:hypothetical protein
MRTRLILVGSALLAVAALLVWHFSSAKIRTKSSAPVASVPSEAVAVLSPAAGVTDESGPTIISAHNLLLRKGPDFRVYIPWLRGRMVRTRRGVNPSFDDPDSFVLEVNSGIIHANIGDIANFLNASVSNSPLKNIALSGDGDQIKMRGTLHKIVSLPVELIGTISVVPDNRIQIHVTRLSLLKIPLKGLLGGFHIRVSDLFHPAGLRGVQVSENDITIDTQQILPPPHIRGRLTSVRVTNPDLEEIYGNGQNAVSGVKQWRNFLQLSDGTLDFGKLTMRHVDLMMIDISNDAWFDLDLENYQDQLVNGYSRMTPEAGLLIFMPDRDTLPHSKTNHSISLEWLKNRNLPPPADIFSK